MNRRKFLQSLGALGLLPSLPVPALALPAAPAGTAVAPPFTNHTYQWAEMIVRAHNKCNLGLLQRSLHVDETVARALKSSLIENGVVHAEANAYGIHKATKPLYEGAFANVHEPAKRAAETVIEAVEDMVGESAPETQPDTLNEPDDQEHVPVDPKDAASDQTPPDETETQDDCVSGPEKP